MRNLRFRVWFDPGMQYFTLEDVVNNAIYKNGSLDLMGWRGLDDYEVTQFTGLRDKNGKEIYEGDIVKVLLNDYSGKITKKSKLVKVICEIIFEDGCFCHKFGYHDTLPVNGWESEVIGNIYENPELLEAGE